MPTIRSLSLNGPSFDRKLLCFTYNTSLDLGVPGVLPTSFSDLLTISSTTLESISISAWGAILAEEVDGPIVTCHTYMALNAGVDSGLALRNILVFPNPS